MAKLTYKKKKKLPKTAFAIPNKRKYPIFDKVHARNALARVAQSGTADEKAQVRKAVCKRYPNMGQCKKRK